MKRRKCRQRSCIRQSPGRGSAALGSLLVLTVLGALGISWSQAFADDEDLANIVPPIAGQPVNFSGAIGSYTITMQAQPTVLQAEDPILLRVRIRVSGQGSLKQIRRPDLRKLRQFARQFAIENGPERDLSEAQAREFDYTLRPRDAAVKQIPALPFVYYNPAILPVEKGYQWAYAQAIPLTVKPRSAVTAAQVAARSPLPDPPPEVLQVASDPRLLERAESLSSPGWGILLVLAVTPPLVCLAWFVVWRRLNPDAARSARQRRSRASRVAVLAIEAAKRLPPDKQALRVKDALVTYLCERLDFVVCEPTPLEVSTYLQHRGLSDELVGKARQFFTSCDGARFAPQWRQEQEVWTIGATQLLETLEEELWPAQAT